VETLLSLLLALSMLAACGNNTPTMKTETKSAPAAKGARKPPDENAAQETLRKISEAQSTYFKINRRYALTFDELIEARLLSSEPSAADTGYDFKLRPAADAQTFKLSVIPSDPIATNGIYLFMDQTGVIRVEIGKEATAESPVVK
jgi:hypothetical protein